VLDYLDDLEADFRTFYRLDPGEILELAGPHFLALAMRVTAYAGVMQARVMAQQEDELPGQNQSGDRVVESTPAALQGNADLADVIDYG